ncbi:hypothetical protein F5Y12DRAFT_266691 [Xylaria sp. FL1777]|nr:hypothetical protein F5Y12DRAFT_266691 [Xylaria sp. FL1777]
MKIIIIGATGFVGGAVVKQAIRSNKISHIFLLARERLPDDIENNAKITVILHPHFSQYPDRMLLQIVGAQACIWALGGHAYQFTELSTARRVSIDYPIAAANGFIDVLAARLPTDQPFRFVFVSACRAVWDEDKFHLFMRNTRRIKGKAERKLFQLEEANPEMFDVRIVRPARIIKRKGGRLWSKLVKLLGLMPVDDVAQALIRIATDNFPYDKIFEVAALRHIGGPSYQQH